MLAAFTAALALLAYLATKRRVQFNLPEDGSAGRIPVTNEGE